VTSGAPRTRAGGRCGRSGRPGPAAPGPPGPYRSAAPAPVLPSGRRRPATTVRCAAHLRKIWSVLPMNSATVPSVFRKRSRARSTGVPGRRRPRTGPGRPAGRRPGRNAGSGCPRALRPPRVPGARRPSRTPGPWPAPTCCRTPSRSCGPPVPGRSGWAACGSWPGSCVVDEPGGGIGVDGDKIGKPYRGKATGRPEGLEPALDTPAQWCRRSRRSRPGWRCRVRGRLSSTPCGPRSVLTTLSRHHGEESVCRGAARGHEKRGRRVREMVCGGNCRVRTDVVKVSVSPTCAGVCSKGSSCPTGGSVTVKGNRP
jgi:hypothetical protein